MHCSTHQTVVDDIRACDRCGAAFCPDCLVAIQGRQYCARCKTEYLTDVQSGVRADELPLAGIGRRFAALLIDGLLLGLPVLIVMFAVIIPAAMRGVEEEPPAWLNWMSWALAPIYIIYEGLMLQARGQTLGKMAMSIRVVQPNGQDISTGQAWGRSVVRALFVSCLALINYIPAFFTKEKTCVHDMAARTRVVTVR